jgi:DNA polymerase elongation subunit (family B)
MKLLLLDVETSPNTAYVWSLWKENIPLSRLIDSGQVLCYSAKWLGDEEIFFDSIFNSKVKKMLKGIHKLLEEADAVIHYNGSAFDIPTLNKEFLLNGMKPPSSYKQIDLLKTARNKFRFVSNKLDYVAQALGVGKKSKHEGFELWIKCMNNDPEAWKVMEEYNKNDVILLEEVYYQFLPWIKGHPNMGLYSETESAVCPHCASTDLHKRGFSFTSTGKYQRYQCKGCGAWSRARKAIKTTLELTTERV